MEHTHQKLQRGRAHVSAESSPVHEEAIRAILASTGPRSRERGEDRTPCRRRPPGRSFN